jgi:hypothetical protein
MALLQGFALMSASLKAVRDQRDYPQGNAAAALPSLVVAA